MALSVLHRGTGLVLTLGLPVMVAWLLAAVSGAEAYTRFAAALAHPLGRVFCIGYSFAFFYHLCNGLRHLVWDTGHGLERASARRSGRITIVTAVVLTLAFWVLLMQRLGGAA